jgi:hypothetical protein
LEGRKMKPDEHPDFEGDPADGVVEIEEEA